MRIFRSVINCYFFDIIKKIQLLPHIDCLTIADRIDIAYSKKKEKKKRKICYSEDCITDRQQNKLKCGSVIIPMKNFAF